VRTGVSQAAKLAAAGVRTLIDARMPGFRRKLLDTAKTIRALRGEGDGGG